MAVSRRGRAPGGGHHASGDDGERGVTHQRGSASLVVTAALALAAVTAAFSADLSRVAVARTAAQTAADAAALAAAQELVRPTGRAAPEVAAEYAERHGARLACLFDRVDGLWIVSGYRTRAEQAALYEQKPGLAAPPGQSNHELGLAADLGYPSSSAENEAHVAAPGCGLEFPVSYEPWHVEP